MRHKNNKAKLLRKAKRLLGQTDIKRRAQVFRAVAERLGVQFPATKDAGYTMLANFCKENYQPKRKPVTAKPAGDVNAPEFLESYEWRRLRMQVLVKRGARCECCGATPKDGFRMHVDHIKPRRLFPALALDETNLQVLCEVCNHGKGNWDQTDWRKPEEPKPIAVAPVVSVAPADPMRPRLVKRA